MGELIVNPGGVKYLQNQVSNVASDIAYVIDGNKSSTAVASGNYVVLINSTISGRANGAYKAAKAIPANTVLDSSYLTAVSGGITNELSNNLDLLQAPTATGDVLSSATSVTKTTIFKGNGSSYTGTLPSAIYRYGVFIVTPRDNNRIVQAVADGAYAVNYYNGSTWNGWQEFALKSDITWSYIDATTTGSGNVQTDLAFENSYYYFVVACVAYNYGGWEPKGDMMVTPIQYKNGNKVYVGFNVRSIVSPYNAVSNENVRISFGYITRR